MKQVLLAVLGMTVAATLATIGLYQAGKTAWAVGIGAFTFFSWLSLLILLTAVAASWWAATLMHRGGELVLRGQESDDRRDVSMIRSITALTKAVLSQGSQKPPLLLPGQREPWLPELDELTEGEFEVTEKQPHRWGQ